MQTITSHPLVEELALALHAIESLTSEETLPLMYLQQATDCEPVFAFLALHVRLSHVLASPHGGWFRACLRDWQANEAIDDAIWRDWGVQYRPRYKAGDGTAANLRVLDALEPSNFANYLIGVQRSSQPLTVESAAGLLRQARPGDRLRWRMPSWPDGLWRDEEVVEVNSRGTWVRNRGRRSKRAILNPDVLRGCSVEVIRCRAH